MQRAARAALDAAELRLARLEDWVARLEGQRGGIATLATDYREVVGEIVSQTLLADRLQGDVADLVLASAQEGEGFVEPAVANVLDG